MTSEKVTKWKVQLYCYDISQGMANAFSQQIVGKHIEGIWHSGVVVYGKEFYWQSFLAQGRPGQTPFGVPQKIFDMGETSIPENQAQQFISTISSKYTIATYKLLSNNCNNFSQEFVNFLTGKPIPALIINQPENILSTPFGQMIKPMIENFENNMKQTLVNSGSFQGQPPSLLGNLYRQALVSSPTISSPTISTLPVSSPSISSPSISSPPSFVFQPNTYLEPLKTNQEKIPFLSRDGTVTALCSRLVKSPEAQGYEEALKNLASYLEDPNQVDQAAPSQSLEWIEKTLNAASPALIFSLLYMVRLLILRSQPLSFFVTKRDLFQNLFNTYSGESTPKPARLMAFTVAVNFFNQKVGVDFILNLNNAILIQNALSALKTGDESVQMTVAALIHNFVISSPNTQAVSALGSMLLQFLETATVSNEETLFRMLKAVLFSVEFFVDLAKKHEWIKYKDKSPRINEIVQDIMEFIYQ